MTTRNLLVNVWEAATPQCQLPTSEAYKVWAEAFHKAHLVEGAQRRADNLVKREGITLPQATARVKGAPACPCPTCKYTSEKRHHVKDHICSQHKELVNTTLRRVSGTAVSKSAFFLHFNKATNKCCHAPRPVRTKRCATWQGPPQYEHRLVAACALSVHLLYFFTAGPPMNGKHAAVDMPSIKTVSVAAAMATAVMRSAVPIKTASSAPVLKVTEFLVISKLLRNMPCASLI
ncbi:hypothetical protein T492DRAFT_850891 [Pavlovales sp. CCMP2436]|nr:hypothetical protein T492DRAFT_850891 [Pavlovales sp. CCMP2436]